MRTSTWLSGRRTVGVLVVCLLVLGVAPPPAAAQCEIAKLLAFDGAGGDLFGWSLSISGDVAVVGAFADDDSGFSSGSAYVYRFNGLSWVQEAKLTASDGAFNDFFGQSVSISGDVIVAGAYADDDNGADSGSAYVFVKPPGGWLDMTQTAKLTASDGAAVDRFGSSVSISGDVIVVGANGDASSTGSAYVFEKPLGGWVDMTETAKLTAFDGAAVDNFGISVSIEGDVAVVGANRGDGIVVDSGSAYVFVKPAGGWVSMTQTAKLLAADGAASDFFGSSVSISGDVALVAGGGAAYLFQKPRGGWVNMTQTAKLTASDGAAFDAFGFSVSISGDVVVVGGPLDDDNGGDSGSAYVFAFTLPDCNLNGICDTRDIFLGLSCDSNANLIPDECERVIGGPDISGPGGVPDGCVDAFDLGALLAAWCSVAGGNPCGTCGP